MCVPSQNWRLARLHWLDGQVGIHDPSTIVQSNGKFYTHATGGGSLVSDDGWTWRRGAFWPRISGN